LIKFLVYLKNLVFLGIAKVELSEIHKGQTKIYNIQLTRIQSGSVHFSIESYNFGKPKEIEEIKPIITSEIIKEVPNKIKEVEEPIKKPEIEKKEIEKKSVTLYDKQPQQQPKQENVSLRIENTENKPIKKNN